jgi:hypothetical protein
MRCKIHHAAVAYKGFNVEKITKKETKTNTTPMRNTTSNSVAFDLSSILKRKKSMKINRIATLKTLMENGEIKNHFISILLSDMILEVFGSI